MKRAERPFSQIPLALVIGFLAIFSLQMVLHQVMSKQAKLNYQPLSVPLDAGFYRSMSMGSERLLSYLLSIRLQLHDNQAGKHIRYNQINYRLLVDWLNKIYQVNPQSEYPMMLASRVYSQTRDKEQLRILLEFIQRTFSSNPQLHWRRLAEAAVIAKHQLGDLKFALEMSEKLAAQPASVKMPQWARDFHFILLGDLNEFESALAIIIGLLQSGSIKDPDEIRFLESKLLEFQHKLLLLRQNDGPLK